MVPVQNGDQILSQVPLQRFFQAVAAVGHRDQLLDIAHATGTGQRSQLLGQHIELKIHQVA